MARYASRLRRLPYLTETEDDRAPNLYERMLADKDVLDLTGTLDYQPNRRASSVHLFRIPGRIPQRPLMPEANPATTRPRTGWLPTVLFVALAAAPLVAVAAIGSSVFLPGGTALEIEMRATGGTEARLFWTPDESFSEENSRALPLHQHPGEFERLQFPLPSRPLRFVRFDPLNGPGEVLIRTVRVIDRDGRTVRTIDPMVMEPLISRM